MEFASARPRTLIVDDDVRARGALARVVRGLGMHCTEAGTGTAALGALARDSSIAVVLLDLYIPYPDGFAVLEAIRRQSQWDAVKVLMCTGASDPGTVQLSLASGANGYLVKPVATADLSRHLVELGVLVPHR